MKKQFDDGFVNETTAAVAVRFRTFGGGRTHGSEFNPLVKALKDEPASFAAGVDVREVVQFVTVLVLEKVLAYAKAEREALESKTKKAKK